MNRLLKSRIAYIVYPEVAPAAEGSGTEPSPTERPACTERSERALPACTERSECVPPACPERSERALNSAEGLVPSKTEGSRAKPAKPRRQSPRRPRPRKLAWRGAIGSAPPDPGRHERKCSICRHPDRDAIEEEFIHWRRPYDIAEDYNLPDRFSVYRHAHATGLFAHRKRNLRFVLEKLLERVDRVTVTAEAVVRAVRAYTRINDAGEWVEPPTRIILSSGSPLCTERSERALNSAEGPAGPLGSPEKHSRKMLGSNRNTAGLENDPTRCKQRATTFPNHNKMRVAQGTSRSARRSRDKPCPEPSRGICPERSAPFALRARSRSRRMGSRHRIPSAGHDMVELSPQQPPRGTGFKPVLPAGHDMVELSPQQICVLEQLQARQFLLVGFPLYANYVGVRKGDCAALLAPVEGAGMKPRGEPCYLVAGNLSVRLRRGDRLLFVWKEHELEATPERLAELDQFTAELQQILRAET